MDMCRLTWRDRAVQTDVAQREASVDRAGVDSIADLLLTSADPICGNKEHQKYEYQYMYRWRMECNKTHQFNWCPKYQSLSTGRFTINNNDIHYRQSFWFLRAENIVQSCLLPLQWVGEQNLTSILCRLIVDMKELRGGGVTMQTRAWCWLCNKEQMQKLCTWIWECIQCLYL